MPEIRRRIKPVCADCGSDNVQMDASCNWDNDKQEWVLGSVYDDAFCQECDNTAKLNWLES